MEVEVEVDLGFELEETVTISDGEINVTVDFGDGIPDAESDGSIYGRKDAAWVEITEAAQLWEAETIGTEAMISPVSDKPINLSKIQFITDEQEDDLLEGQARWNPSDECLDLALGGGVIAQIPQEQYTKVRNTTGATLLDGRVVYVNGRSGKFPTVAYALSDAASTGCTLGLLTQDILHNAFGKVTTFGYVQGIKTNYTGTGIWGTTWAVNDVLWVSKTNAGVITNVEPDVPHHSDRIGVVAVLGAAGIGSIFVNILRSQRLVDLADVDGTPLATTGQIPVWDNESEYFDFNFNINDYKNYCGFENRTDSVITAADSDGWKVTIAPVTTSFNVWAGKVKRTFSTSQVVSVPTDLTLYFIYVDTDGSFAVSTTPWDIDTDIAPAAVFYRDGLNYALTDERHSYRRNTVWHSWAHNNIGAMYKSGLTGTFLASTFSITQGVIADEDINFDTGGAKTTTTHWHRATTLDRMRLVRNNTTIYPVVGGQMAYDLAGVLTAMDANRYGVYWVYASNDPEEPIYTVVTQAQYNNLTLARNAAAPTIYLSTAEWKLLYRVIYRNTSTISYIEAADFRTVQTGTPISATTQDHSALINRDAENAHPAKSILVDEAPVADYTDVALNDTLQDLAGKVAGVQETIAPDYIVQLVLATNDVNEITFTHDKDGNPISIVENEAFEILIKIPSFNDGAGGVANGRVYIRLNDPTAGSPIYEYRSLEQQPQLGTPSGYSSTEMTFRINNLPTKAHGYAIGTSGTTDLSYYIGTSEALGTINLIYIFSAVSQKFDAGTVITIRKV